MQYKKLTSGDTIIEFHNNWLGQETVIVNGQIVSKKSSVWGIHHPFQVMENGQQVNYVLTTKVNQHMQVAVDLSKNGEVIQEDVIVGFGSKSTWKTPENKAKKQGLLKLNDYDLHDALTDFEAALKISPKDPEIYFHMACAYSILEKVTEGFDCLKNAVANNLQDQEMILNHDKLAFLRMHKGFEDFLNSGFTEYDENLIAKKEDAD